MHKSENEKIDFILDEHERIFRKQGSLCMALGKGFLVIAILCGVATFCVSGLYLKSLCLSVACCCGVFSRIFNYYSVPEESRRVLSRQELLWLMSLTEDCPDMHQELLNCLLSGKKLTVFTTRPDTAFGVTYMVLAPEHPYVAELASRFENAAEVQAYVEKTATKSDLQRSMDESKTGGGTERD